MEVVHNPGTWCEYVYGNVIPFGIQDVRYYLSWYLSYVAYDKQNMTLIHLFPIYKTWPSDEFHKLDINGDSVHIRYVLYHWKVVS